MHTRRRSLVNQVLRLAFLVVALVRSGLCQGQEKKAAGSLPEAALKALQTSFPDATVTEVEREREDGVPYFEVEMEAIDKEFDVEVTADGRIGEIETEMWAKDLPPVVAAKAKEAAAGGELGKVEKHEVRGVPLYGTFAALAQAQIVYEITCRAPGDKRRGTIVVRDNGDLVRVVKGDADDEDDDGDDDDDDEDDD